MTKNISKPVYVVVETLDDGTVVGVSLSKSLIEAKKIATQLLAQNAFDDKEFNREKKNVGLNRVVTTSGWMVTIQRAQ